MDRTGLCCSFGKLPKKFAQWLGRAIATRCREAHYKHVDDLLGNLPDKPTADASPKEKMAYKLATDIGKEIYRLRKCTVEPVIGIIKEILGFRQFSLRGLKNVAGEWRLVFLALNLKRMHSIWLSQELY